MNNDTWNAFGATGISEALVLNTLTTNGRDPLELCFLVEYGIRRWHPEGGLLSNFLIDNAQLAQACKAYLKAKGLSFESWDSVEERARSQQWPGLETFLSRIEHYKVNRRNRTRKG